MTDRGKWRNGNMNGIGQDFDNFLKEQGIFEEVNELAAKKLITYQLKQAMDEQNVTKSYVAKKMKTSRVAVDNILDPAFNTSIESLERFANILGKRLTISLT